MIWSKSLASGEVSSFYKFSNVSPLHKKESKALASNYRPISLTSHIIKVFERVVRKKLASYLEMNNLICNKQHGFRSGQSCLSQLLHHFDDVLESLTNNADFDSIYLDYAKAFDKVDHKLLIRKLHRYSLNPKIIRWIDSFLSDRKQAVVVDGHLSFLAPIISGVRQGTVLGPILFLIFINDIEHCITNSIIRCFADDTRVSIPVFREQDVAKLQNDLYSVINWSENNNMSLHKDKFEYMCHRHNRRGILTELPFVSELYQYSISEDKSLAPVGQLRDLGVLVSNDLSWTPHIKTIANKARQKAAWVLSVFTTRSPVIMLTLYKSMVRSLLEYCCPLWHPSKISDIQELESVQKAFTARITELHELNYLAVVPSAYKYSSAANKSLYDNLFAVTGPKLWNAMPYHFNSISASNHSSLNSCCRYPIHRLSGGTLSRTQTRCCVGGMIKRYLICGVVARCDGPVKV